MAIKMTDADVLDALRSLADEACDYSLEGGRWKAARHYALLARAVQHAERDEWIDCADVLGEYESAGYGLLAVTIQVAQRADAASDTHQPEGVQ